MSNRHRVVCGSYRPDGMDIRLAPFVVERLRPGGEDVGPIDAKASNLPVLHRGDAP